jgi:hypothetical protein
MIARTSRAVVAGVLTTTLVSPATARATAADASEHPAWGDRTLVWEPYRTQGFTSPAGQLCDFTLQSEPIADEEMVATVSRFSDGSPRVQAFRGRLVVRYTNAASGATVDQDLSGHAVVRYFEDGASTMYTYGRVGVGFRETDPYPRGMYTLDGFHVVHTAADRDPRDMVLDGGTEHNVCDDLG